MSVTFHSKKEANEYKQKMEGEGYVVDVKEFNGGRFIVTLIGKKKSNNPPPKLLGVRHGKIDANGAYFSTSGASTYFSEGEDQEEYELGDLKIADTGNRDVAKKLVEETLKDSRTSNKYKKKLKEELDSIEKGEDPFIDYMLFDETPMSDIAKKLGYDAAKVYENDDYPGQPSSVFVMNVSKVKHLGKHLEEMDE